MTAPSEQQKLFDLIVIGGGINGVAIARDAALRGLSVVLLEKEDFGSGASTKTSKLAHGGVRYLQQLRFGLVRESLRERALLLNNAPHLVRPLPFMLPVYTKDPHPLWQINLGLFLYDYMAGDHSLPKHHKLEAGEILKNFPALKQEGLKGGFSYCDAQMLDHRILIENMLSAEAAGARVDNYAEVIGLIQQEGKIQGVHIRRLLDETREDLFGRVVVNAAGAWASQIGKMESNAAAHCEVCPTKGVHILIPKIASGAALLLHAPQDKRVFFVLPWGESSLVGTTDTFYDSDPDDVQPLPDDRHYLLEALQFYFPSLAITEASIQASFAGLRPLPAGQKKVAPSDIVREHAVHVSEGGLISVLGGKYTTYRAMAEEVVNTVADRLGKSKAPCTTAKLPLPGACGALSELPQKLRRAGLEEPLVEHLAKNYGMISLKILDIIKADPSEARRICLLHPHIFAELTHAITVEHAKTLEDWFYRRTSIAYTACGGHRCAEAVAAHFAKLQDRRRGTEGTAPQKKD